MHGRYDCSYEYSLSSETASSETRYQPQTNSNQSKYSITDKFYVLTDLREDVVLGAPLLEAIYAYKEFRSNFVAPETDSQYSQVLLVRKKKGGEGNGQPKPPRTELDKLKDGISVEDDRHQKR